MNEKRTNSSGMDRWNEAAPARVRRAAYAAALALAVILTAASCAARDAAETGAAQTEPASVTEPQVTSPEDDGSAARAAALAIFDELDAAELEDRETDFSDEARVLEYVERRREIYGRLAALELSWRDEKAQGEIRSGIEGMLQYLDALPAFCAIRYSGTQEAEEMRGDLSAQYVAAFGSLNAARLALKGDDEPVLETPVLEAPSLEASAS
jgi:hypothetical protein